MSTLKEQALLRISKLAEVAIADAPFGEDVEKANVVTPFSELMENGTADIHAVLIEQLQKIAQVDSKTISDLFALLPQRAPDLWRMLVVGAYLDDQINLGKAAEMLGKHPVELRREFLKQGVPVKIGVQSIAEVDADVKTLENLERRR